MKSGSGREGHRERERETDRQTDRQTDREKTGWNCRGERRRGRGGNFRREEI